MKYYTGKGDNGMTDIKNGRVKKDSAIIKFIGDLDELSAFLGYAISKINYQDINETLKVVERKIYILSAIASGYNTLVKNDIDISSKDVKEIEKTTDRFSKEINPLTKFLYPNGSESACIINICRTMARRIERDYIESGVKNDYIGAYLNRLSSLLFVIFRLINKRDNFTEEFF